MAAARLTFGARPLLKAAATSSFLMAVGDVACQAVQQRSLPAAKRRIDWARTGRFAVVGATLHGPYFFTGMQLLDLRFGAAQTLKTAITKSAAGQVTLFPVYLTAFFLYIARLEGCSWSDAVARLQNAFPTAAATGTLFWPLANIVTFSLPPSRRLAFLGVAGAGWNAGLSWMNSQSSSSSSSSSSSGSGSGSSSSGSGSVAQKKQT